MRKKVSIVWLLSVIIVLSMAGCRSTSTTTIEIAPTVTNESDKLEFEPRGTYNIQKGGKQQLCVYRFDTPNDKIVVYQISKCIYLVGEDSKKGTKYANVFMKDSEFIALSNKYLLFENKEGKVAISIKETEGIEGGASLCKVYSFDELSNEEKHAFIYPVECQEVRK